MKDIFNWDESGLFWRGIPNRHLDVSSTEQCKDGKLAKDRINILFCTSAAGEKLPSLIIGKAQSPQRFIDKKSPKGIVWRTISKTWMNSSLLQEYLVPWIITLWISRDELLYLWTIRLVIRLIDLSHVKIILISPNTTAGTQSLDAGIIKNFKSL